MPQGSTLLDGDVIWQTWGHTTSIESDDGELLAYETNCLPSPDGASIAYISKGALWHCAVSGGPPRKLADLPNTITDFWAKPEHVAIARDRTLRRDFLKAGGTRGLHLQLATVCSLKWASGGDELYYALRRQSRPGSSTWNHRVMRAPLSGAPTLVAEIEGGDGQWPTKIFREFDVTRDRRFVVASSYGLPLIWETAGNKPRATCFDFLTPATGSDRFLGVEMDSRELVLVDSSFHVIKRYDVTAHPHRPCDLIWSRDERFAICRSRVEHPSDNWEGFRIDLQTGENRTLGGGRFSDRFYFTGHGGEFVRIGLLPTRMGGYADGSGGMTIELVPDGEGKVRTIFQFSRRPQKDDYRVHEVYPAVLCNSAGTQMLMALPRTGKGSPGFHYHIIDRKGHARPLAPLDADAYYTPYFPVAFAANDQLIVARDQLRIFTIPVAKAVVEDADDE